MRERGPKKSRSSYFDPVLTKKSDHRGRGGSKMVKKVIM